MLFDPKKYEFKPTQVLNPWLHGITVVVIFFLGLACRLSLALERTGKDAVFFNGPDSYYHARRVFYTLHHFPKLLVADTGLSLNSPPMLSPWPPLFDVFAALFVMPFASMGMNPSDLEIVLALFPPLIGVFTLVVFYFLSRRWLGERAGLISTLMFTLMPAHIDVTMFAALDHHCFEALVIVGVALMTDVALAKKRPGILAAAALVMGLSLGLAQVFWVYAGFYAVFLIYSHWRGQSTLIASLTLLIGASVMTTISLMQGQPAWSYKTLSVLQPLTLALPLFFVVTKKIIGNSKLQPLAFVNSLALGIALTLLFGVFLPTPAFQELLAGSGFFSRNPVVSLISESRPIWQTSALNFGYLGRAVYLTPFLAILLWYYWRKRQLLDQRKMQFFLWLIGLFVMTTQQMRFSSALSPLVALVFGFWLWVLLRRVCYEKFSIALVLAMSLIVFNVLPYVRAMAFESKTEPSEIKKQRLYFSNWLRMHSEANGAIDDPSVMPAYRVMAPWHWGHEILLRANRGVVANPFIFDIDSPGLVDSLSLFYAWNDQEVIDYCNQHSIRYILFDPKLDDTERNLAVLDLPLDRYLTERDGRFHLTDKFKSTLLYRFGFLIEDTRNHQKRPLPFRLVYEGPIVAKPFGQPDSQYKLYEYVDGARVSMQVAPNEKVRLEIDLLTNQDRYVKLSWTFKADGKGELDFILPYATSGESHSAVKSVKNYQLTTASGMIYFLFASERDVSEGRQVLIEHRK